MKKIRKFNTTISEAIPLAVHKHIGCLPSEAKTKDNIDACHCIGDYVTAAHGDNQALLSMMSAEDNKLDDEATRYMDNDEKERYKDETIRQLQQKIKQEYPFEKNYGRKTLLRLFTDCKEDILQLQSDILFKTLKMHSLARLLELNDYDLEDGEDFDNL